MKGVTINALQDWLDHSSLAWDWILYVVCDLEGLKDESEVEKQKEDM